MTSLKAPAQSSLSRGQHIAIAATMTLAAFTAIGTMGYRYFTISKELGQTLMTAPLKTPSGKSTWAKQLNAASPLGAAFKCQNTQACAKWYNQAFNSRMNMDMQLYLIMGLFMGTAIAWRKVPSSLNMKDPGMGKWAGLDDPAIIDILNVPINNKKLKTKIAKMDKINPRTFYLGHFIPWTTDGFQWKQTRLAYLRDWSKHMNVLVSGAPGSGKTRGIFRQNIILDLERGDTAIVFDLKWPQIDSGFLDLILYAHKKKRPLYIFAPFSPNSMRLPLLEGISTMDEALKLAKAIIAPPEFDEETGKYYKDTERRALAAMILAIAQGPTPTMKELQRLGLMNVAEFEAWYKRQQNPEIKQNLKSMFDMRTDQISATLAGVVNTLQIFFNENVSRATTSGENPNENIDLLALFRHGGMLIFGMESKNIQEADGALLMQLVKRRIDQALLTVASESKGSRLPKTATYYLDELPGLGRMPYLMQNLAQLRSRSVCLMLGVQNSDQGSLVYKRDYWRALATNNLGTRIDFIQGMLGDDAKSLSEEIGEYTVYTSSMGKSGHQMFSTPWSPDSKKSENLKLEKRRLLTLEEIRRFPPDMAVVMTKGQNPMLIATPAIDTETLLLRTPEGKYVEIKNQLYPLWKEAMKDVKDLETEVKQLINMLSVSGPNKEVEIVEAAPEYWRKWLGRLLNDGAITRIQKEDKRTKIMIRIDTLSERISRPHELRYFEECGWINRASNGEELTITKDGLEIAGPILQNSLIDFLVRGPGIYWMRTHPDKARHTPETLTITPKEAEEIYPIVPDFPLVDIGGVQYLQIPLSDPKAISEAISRAEMRLQKDSPQTQGRKAKQAARNQTAAEQKDGEDGEEKRPHNKVRAQQANPATSSQHSPTLDGDTAALPAPGEAQTPQSREELNRNLESLLSRPANAPVSQPLVPYKEDAQSGELDLDEQQHAAPTVTEQRLDGTDLATEDVEEESTLDGEDHDINSGSLLESLGLDPRTGDQS